MAMADLTYVRNRQKNNDTKNSFDSHPYPAGIILLMHQGRSSDSSRLLRLPSYNQWQRMQ